MKKLLVLFIIIVVLLTIAKVAYDKYCESKPKSCQKMKPEDRDDHVNEGLDW